MTHVAFGPGVGLVVVDVQNDFADPHGSLSVAGGEAVVDTANGLIEAARAADATIAYTQDWHPPDTPHFEKDGGVWPVHCVRDTWGAELHPALHVHGQIVRKGTGGEDGYSGFTMRDPLAGDEHSTGLAEILREHGVRSVVIAGLTTDYCVKESALDALRLGFAVTVVRDAIAAVDVEPGDGDRALEELAAAGVTLA